MESKKMMILSALALLATAVSGLDIDEHLNFRLCDYQYVCLTGYCCKNSYSTTWRCCRYPWQWSFNSWTTTQLTTTSASRSTTTLKSTTTTPYKTPIPWWTWSIVGSGILIFIVITKICCRLRQSKKQTTPGTNQTRQTRPKFNHARNTAPTRIYVVGAPNTSNTSSGASPSATNGNDGVSSSPTTNPPDLWKQDPGPIPTTPPPAYNSLTVARWTPDKTSF